LSVTPGLKRTFKTDFGPVNFDAGISDF